MKILILALVLLLSCTTNKAKPINPSNVEKVEKVEGAVVSKKIVKTVSGFNYVKKHKAYFRNDLSASLKSRVMKKLNRGNSPKNDNSKLSSLVKPVTSKFVYPFWSDYFGDSKKVSGTIQLNIQVSKYGKAEIIIVEQGIDEEVDRITVEYVKNFPFKPAIHKKSGNPTRAWIKIRNTF